MRSGRYLLAAVAACLLTAARADAEMRARVVSQHWQPSRPTLEQIAYRFWGARLEEACPNRSLRFRRVPPAWGGVTDDVMGGSWGDCQPYVRRKGRLRPEVCATAIHETGHEVGLNDAPGRGGVMDNTRLVIGQIGFVRRRHRWVLRQAWTNIPDVCQPGHFDR